MVCAAKPTSSYSAISLLNGAARAELLRSPTVWILPCAQQKRDLDYEACPPINWNLGLNGGGPFIAAAIFACSGFVI